MRIGHARLERSITFKIKDILECRYRDSREIGPAQQTQNDTITKGNTKILHRKHRAALIRKTWKLVGRCPPGLAIISYILLGLLAFTSYAAQVSFIPTTATPRHERRYQVLQSSATSSSSSTSSRQKSSQTNVSPSLRSAWTRSILNYSRQRGLLINLNATYGTGDDVWKALDEAGILDDQPIPLEPMDGGVRLAGSSRLPYMGRVEVYRRATEHHPKGWGVLCGNNWNQNDAVVVCRQLGYTNGNVIPLKRAKIFGNAQKLPVVGSRLRCSGTEENIADCPGYWLHEQEPSRGKAGKSRKLKCDKWQRSVGVVCGCQVKQIEHSHRPKCYASVAGVAGYPVDNFYCRYSCRRGYKLIGKSTLSCRSNHVWSEDQPRCLNKTEYELYDQNIRHPCMPNPCRNNGVCEEIQTDSEFPIYRCKCKPTFVGPHCRIQRITDCGVPARRPQLRIIGGHIAHDEQFPWLAQIKFFNKLICGGTLIAPYWVLTAAHCGIQVTKPMKNMTAQSDNWSITLGERSQFTKFEKFHISLAVLNTYTNYEHDMPRKDIAMLRLHKRAEETRLIKYACLPSMIPGATGRKVQKGQFNDPVPGESCTVAGWGRTLPEDDTFPEYLNYVKLTVHSNALCSGKNTDEHNYNIGHDMYCASGTAMSDDYGFGNARDACMGDSGGPMLCEKDGKQVVNGIVSFGYECAATDEPGVYTKVSSYLDWIYRVMETYDPEGDFNQHL